jgi:hypothetical protein
MRGKKTGGRLKGSHNKSTATLKEMIENALAAAGGEEYLAQQARENPGAFMGLVSKLIPRDLNVSGEVRHSLESLIVRSLTGTDSRPSG